jgi:hypothetical protein
MAGFRYSNEEKQFLTNLVKDKQRDFDSLLKEAQEKGDSVLQQIISKQLAVASSAMDKLTGSLAE